MVLSLPAVGLATVDGALAGGAGLRHGAVGAVGGAGGVLLVPLILLVLLFLLVLLVIVVVSAAVWESGGEGDAHEEGGTEEGELHDVWEVGIESEKVMLMVLLGYFGALDWGMVMSGRAQKRRSGRLYRYCRSSSLQACPSCSSHLGCRSEDEGYGNRGICSWEALSEGFIESNAQANASDVVIHHDRYFPSDRTRDGLTIQTNKEIAAALTYRYP